MAKREKRLHQLRQNPKNVTFAELGQVLEDYHFILDTVTGSHHTFRATVGERTWKLTIPWRRSQVKPVYVRVALQAIAEMTPAEPGVSEEEHSDGDSN